MHLFGSIRCTSDFYILGFIFFKKKMKIIVIQLECQFEYIVSTIFKCFIENGINYGEYLADTVLFLRWRVSGGPCSLITLLTAVM